MIMTPVSHNYERMIWNYLWETKHSWFRITTDQLLPLLHYLLNFDLRVELGNIVIFGKFYLWQSSTYRCFLKTVFQAPQPWCLLSTQEKQLAKDSLLNVSTTQSDMASLNSPIP